MTGKTALIVGASHAGCSAALALRTAGYTVELFEATERKERRGTRGWYAVMPNGLHALSVLGIDAAVLRQQGTIISHLSLGSTLVSFGDSLAVTGQVLDAALLTRVEESGVNVHFGQKIIGVEKHDAGVVLRFETGEPARGDLIVGADGVHSIIRTHLNPDCDLLRTYNSFTANGWTTVTPRTQLGEPGKLYFVPGQRISFAYAQDVSVWQLYSAARPAQQSLQNDSRRTWWFAKWKAESSETGDARTQILNRCKDDPNAALAHDILSAAETEVVGPLRLHSVAPVPKWHDDASIVLTGSALHAIPSDSGVGVAFSFEDAVVLGRCLSSSTSTAEALTSYEAKRRARCERAVSEGSGFANFSEKGQLALTVTSTLLPLVLRVVLAIKGQPSQWMYDYKADAA